MPDKLLPISKAAIYLGVSTKTLRRWESRGYLSPLRTQGNQRRYSLYQLQDLKQNPNGGAKPVQPLIEPIQPAPEIHPQSRPAGAVDGPPPSTPIQTPSRDSGGLFRSANLLPIITALVLLIIGAAGGAILTSPFLRGSLNGAKVAGEGSKIYFGESSTYSIDFQANAYLNTVSSTLVNAESLVGESASFKKLTITEGDGFLASVEGVSNSGGDLDLIAGANIVITPDDATDTITIAATAGSDADTLDGLDSPQFLRADASGILTAGSLTIDLGDLNLSSATEGGITGGGLTDCDTESQTLNYDATTHKFLCLTDASGGGGSGSLDILENGVTVTTDAASLDFLGADFNVTNSPPGEANVAIDYTNSGITRKGQAETVSGGWTFNTNPTTFTTAIDVNAASTIAGLTVDGGSLTLSGLVTDITTADNEDLTLNAAGLGALVLADATISLTGGTAVTIQRNSTSTDTLALNNAGVGSLSLNLTDGDLQTAGTARLTNAGALQNITGLTVSSGTVSLPNGQVGNAELASSSITFAGDSGSSATSLGGTRTIAGGAGLTSADNGSGTLTLTLGTGTGITVNTDGVAVNQGYSFSWTADHTFTLAGAQDLAITHDGTGGAVNVLNLAVTPSSAAGAMNGITVSQASSANTNPLDAGILVSNLDADLAIPAAIQIANPGGGGYSNYLDTPTIDITGTGSLTSVGPNLTAAAALTIASTGSNALTLNSGNNTLTLDSSDITLTTALTSMTTGAAFTVNGTSYVRIGDTNTPGTATGDDALYVEGALEVDGGTIFDGAVTVTTSALAVNSDSITSDGATLVINASGTVEIQDNLTITTGTTISATSVTTFNCTDCVNFDDLSDSPSLDTATIIALGSNNFTINLDSTGEFAIQDGGADVFRIEDANGISTFSDDVDFSFGADENITITNTTASAAADVVSIAATLTTNDVAIDGLSVTLTDNLSASTAVVYGLNIVNADNSTNTGVPDALAHLGNANAAETVANGLLIEQTGAGTLTNGIQVTGTAGTIGAGLLIADGAGTLTTGISLTGTFTNEISLRNAETINNATNGTITLARGDTGALTFSLSSDTSATISNTTGGLTLDSGSGTLTIAATDTTLSATGLTALNTGAAFTINANASYVRIGDSTSPGTATGDDALYIEGALEVDGGTIFDGTVTANTDVALTLALAEDLAITHDGTGGAVNVLNLAVTPSSSAGTMNGITITQSDSANTNPLDAALYINNADTNLTIPAAIQVANTGGGGAPYTDIFNILGTGVSATEFNVLDAEIALGSETSGNYVAGATSNAGLTLTGTEGGTLGINVQANKGLEVDTNGLSLVDCGDTQILKYSTGTGQWGCVVDQTGGGTADLDTVYANDTDKIMGISDATNDLHFRLSAGSTLIVDMVTATAPTVDLANIVNATGTTTTAVDGLQVDFAIGAAGGAIDNAGLRINVTSAGAAATSTLAGLNIGNLGSASVDVTESAIRIGTSWDNEIEFLDATPTVKLGGTDDSSILSVIDSAASPNTILAIGEKTTDNFNKARVSIGAAPGLDQLYVNGRINTSQNQFWEDCTAHRGAVTANGAYGGFTRSANARINGIISVAGVSGVCSFDFTGTLAAGNTGYWGTGNITSTERALNPVMEVRLAATAQADQRAIVGFTDAGGTAAIGADTNQGNNEAFFRKQAAGTNWEAVTRNGAGTETITTGTASTSSYLTLRIEMDNDAAAVRFYVDGTLWATHSDGSVPASSTRLSYYIVNNISATTNRALLVDYYRVWSDDPPAGILAPNEVSIPETGAVSEDAAQNPRDARSILAELTANPEVTYDLSQGLNPEMLITGYQVVASQLTVDTLDVNTIRADKIKANQIEGLEIVTNQISTLKSQVAGLESAAPATPSSERLTITRAEVTLDLKVLGELTAAGGITVDGAATFKGETIFEKIATFIGETIFRGNVRFLGRATFNEDTAGFAVIGAGQTKVAVAFTEEYTQVPVVTVTIGEGKFAQYAYQNLSSRGFEIVLKDPAAEELKFSWIALAVTGAKTTVRPATGSPAAPAEPEQTPPLLEETVQAEVPTIPAP